MSDFAACLKEIRDYHVENIETGRRTRYNPAPEFAAFFANDNAKTISADDAEVVEGLKLYGQSLGRGEAAREEDVVTKETQTLKDNGNTTEAQNTFKQRLEEQREKSKQKAIENVDKIYDEALKIGEANPGAQELILQTVVVIDELFNVLRDKIVDFVKTVVADVVDFAKTAWADIKSTFNRIGNWISGWF